MTSPDQARDILRLTVPGLDRIVGGVGKCPGCKRDCLTMTGVPHWQPKKRAKTIFICKNCKQ